MAKDDEEETGAGTDVERGSRGGGTKITTEARHCARIHRLMQAPRWTEGASQMPTDIEGWND
jgi:hypothetical protein